MELAGGRGGNAAELRFGDVALRAVERRLGGPRGSAALEPKVLRVLTVLAGDQGRAISREALFDACWGNRLAGDDSLNRAIYQARKALSEVGSATVTIETVAASGYVLRIAQAPLDAVCEAARRSWRMGWARGDDAVIERLRTALADGGAWSAEAWGLLALQLSRAAEYAPVESCANLVRQCEEAAREALAIDPAQADARVAHSSLGPLFGDWLGCRARLLEVLPDAPTHFPARHDLAVLEMSTGRVASAVPLIVGLLAEDPLAATVYYKRGYHLYCLGEHDAMDRVLDHGLQLWPGHAGLWQARHLTFAFTGRAAAAIELLEDEVLRPPMPADTLAFHRLALGALASGATPMRDQAIAALSAGARWQSMAVAGVMYLSALGAIEEAMALCERYYLRDGSALVRLRYQPGIEASINEMHRRATQALFLPVTAPLRSHPRFLDLCARMGLADYWQQAGVEPDFMARA